MRGYLSHIAARVSGTRPVVRPRVPSLFEPAKGTEWLNIAHVAGDGHDQETQQGVWAIEQERLAPPFAASTLRPAAERQPGLRAAKMEPSIGQTDPQPHHLASLRALQMEQESNRLAERPSHEGEEHAVREPPHEPAQRQHVIHPELGATKQGMPIHADDRATEPQDVEQRTPAAFKSTHRHDSLRDERESSVDSRERNAARTRREADNVLSSKDRNGQAPERALSAPVVLQPQVSKTAPAAQPTVGQRMPVIDDSGVEPAPSVQVTIGRVIVEAVMPLAAPPSSPVRPATGPRLSLDAYLRQRGGQA